jgi:hypothetical protein
VSVKDLAVFATRATSTPEVGDVGGRAPTLRRTITPARSALVGSTQLSEIEEVVTAVTRSEPTRPGGASDRAPDRGGRELASAGAWRVTNVVERTAIVVDG